MVVPAIKHPCRINYNRNPNESLKEIEAFEDESERNMTASATHYVFFDRKEIEGQRIQTLIKISRVTLVFDGREMGNFQ